MENTGNYINVFGKYLSFVSQRPEGHLLFAGVYRPELVALSVLIAVIVAYTSLLIAQFAERLPAERQHVRSGLLTLGGISMGVGIWAMHFIGMIGFALPCGVTYEPWLTAASILPGVLACVFALHLISRRDNNTTLRICGGVVFGAGIGAMHYAGMAALRMTAVLRYDPWLFLLSIIVAVSLALLALWVRYGIVELFPRIGSLALPSSALVMGGAVAGMHYTAMAAAYFLRGSNADAQTINGADPEQLAIAVTGVTALFTGIALLYAFRQLLRSLEQSQSRLEDAVSGSGDALWEYDAQQRRYWFAPRYFAMLGGSAADFPDQASVQATIVAEDRSALQRGIQQAIRQQQQIELNYRVTRRDGQIAWMRCRGRAIYDKEGRILRSSGTISDITEQVKAQLAAENARRDADAANRAKSEFLANMSHEIRTPMNGVIGFAHLLQRTELTDAQRDYVQKIMTSAEHQLSIVNDILDFSKIEAGKLELESIDMSLHELLGSVASLLAPLCEKKGLEFIIDVAADVPNQMRGDPLRLRQILLNLANNALKFTAAGEIVIRVRREADAMANATATHPAAVGGGNARLRVEVIDSGCGMNPQQMNRLFRAFVQADSSTTRQFGGTGLGLTISRALVEMMGGQIGVDSVEGRGSTFWFTLPAQFGVAAAALAPPLRLNDLSGRRVLVVDDHALVRTVLRDMLTHLGLATEDCADGIAALALMRAASAHGQPFDLALIDWKMPDPDGLELARRIAADEQIAPKPALMMISSHGDGNLLEQARAHGFTRFLAKPVNPSQLFDALADLFLGHSPALAAHSSPPTAHTPRAAALEQLAGARVLLVEDNEINQQVGRELLEGAGIEVELADNGKVALSMVEAKPFDLVLMDMHMPIMDGVAATRILRESHAATDLPILALTANAIASELNRCVEAGMNDTITKPIDPADLFAKLLKWLPLSALRQRSSAAATQPRSAEQSSTLAGSIASAGSNANAAEPEAATPLPQIAGLDAKAGLLRVMGRMETYRNLLTRFVASESDNVSRIRQHIAVGDLSAAQREAHTLKGVAGTLGAVQVQELAKVAEAALKAAQADPTQSAEAISAASGLAALDSALQRLIVAVRGWLDSTAAATEISALPPTELTQRLNRLQSLLAAEDAEAVGLFAELASALSARLGKEVTNKLAAAMDAFDFDSARQTLNQAITPHFRDHGEGI